jgi:hypothetical protein
VSRYARQALRDEEGQVLVFVVLAAGMLIAMLALVVDVGGWFQAQRRAQSVADAAALAAAPQLLEDPAGVPATVTTVADQNWPGARISLPPPLNPSSITVVARPPAGGVLSPFGNMLTPDISASATASIQWPSEISAVAPIVVVCSWCDENTRWSTDQWIGRSVFFTYLPANPGGSPGVPWFAPIQLPGATTRNFSTLVTCDAMAPSSGSCNRSSARAPDSWGTLCIRRTGGGCRDGSQPVQAASQLFNALLAARGTVHLVAIAKSNSGGSFDVVGWGAGTFTNVSQTQPDEVDLEVTFLDHPLLVDGKWVDTGPSGAGDFGIRAIALTG